MLKEEMGGVCSMYGRDGKYRDSNFAERMEAISHLGKYVNWTLTLKFTLRKRVIRMQTVYNVLRITVAEVWEHCSEPAVSGKFFSVVNS
jgi:hypothetical protein